MIKYGRMMMTMMTLMMVMMVMKDVISFSVFCCQLGAMSWDEGGLARVLLQDLDNSGEKHNIYNNKKVDQLKSKQIWLKTLFEQLSILTRSSHV